jgi:hypothetical protein
LNLLNDAPKPIVMRARPVHACTPSAADELIVRVPDAFGDLSGDVVLCHFDQRAVAFQAAREGPES